jgi:hypothetical protein
MAWSDLSMQFCLQLSFGVLLALAFVPKAPVGTLFYRVMGTTALVPVLVAIGVPISTGERGWSDPSVVAALLAVISYPIYSGPVRGKSWGLALGLGILGTAAGVGLLVAGSAGDVGLFGVLLASASALATGAVAGSVGLAMVLGHWYLTVPKLEVRHLTRLNRVSMASMLTSLLLIGALCWVFSESLSEGYRPLFGDTGLFYLGTRLVVGLLCPLGFAMMTSSSLKFRNTRSATGILYASTVLVLIGTAISVSLQDSYGLPL